MRYNYTDVKKIFEEQGCELLDSEYVNNSRKMKYRCSCGNISEISLGHFRTGQRCSICRYKKAANTLKLDFGYVNRFFAEQGCELLENEYKNARTKMGYRCCCGEVSSICFDSFKNGNRCRKCGNAKSSKKQKGKQFGGSSPQRLLQEEVSNFFSDFGCVLLGQYKQCKAVLEFICKCGLESKTTWDVFRRTKKCKICSLKGRSGENHYEWQKDRERLHKDLLFRQRCYKLLKATLKATGRIKNNRTAELLGYDYKQLQDHICGHPNYKQLEGLVWHIDHIFPIKAFIDYSIEDLKVINCLENLRPIAAKENLSKNASYNKKEFESWLDGKGVTYETRSMRI